MMREESTEWTTISVPTDAANQIRDVYQAERTEMRFGQPEPLWGFVLRAACQVDEDGDGGEDK